MKLNEFVEKHSSMPGWILSDHGRVRMLKKTRPERRAEMLAQMEKGAAPSSEKKPERKAPKKPEPPPAKKPEPKVNKKKEVVKKATTKKASVKKKSSWASKKNN